MDNRINIVYIDEYVDEMRKIPVKDNVFELLIARHIDFMETVA